jgi:hypothetical protein
MVTTVVTAEGWMPYSPLDTEPEGTMGMFLVCQYAAPLIRRSAQVSVCLLAEVKGMSSF